MPHCSGRDRVCELAGAARDAARERGRRGAQHQTADSTGVERAIKELPYGLIVLGHRMGGLCAPGTRNKLFDQLLSM